MGLSGRDCPVSAMMEGKKELRYEGMRFPTGFLKHKGQGEREREKAAYCLCVTCTHKVMKNRQKNLLIPRSFSPVERERKREGTWYHLFIIRILRRSMDVLGHKSFFLLLLRNGILRPFVGRIIITRRIILSLFNSFGFFPSSLSLLCMMMRRGNFFMIRLAAVPFFVTVLYVHNIHVLRSFGCRCVHSVHTHTHTHYFLFSSVSFCTFFLPYET